MSTGMHRLLAPLVVLLVLTAGCNGLPGQERGPGSLYEDYLAGSAGTLLVELDHASGAKPSQEAMNDFKNQLQSITRKTVQITTSADLPSNGQNYVYSVNDLKGLADEHQDNDPSGDTVVMHALFVDGRVQNDRVAGLAFLGDTFAIAMGTIKENTCSNNSGLCLGGEPKQRCAVRAVTTHEAGHLLGLVNSPLPMVTPHEMTQDPNPDTAQNEGEAHSNNDGSVMWWQVELGPQLLNLFGGNCGDIPWQFDNNDKADANAVRNG